VEPQAIEEFIVIEKLRQRIKIANNVLEKGVVKRGQLQMWSGSVMSILKKIYGSVHDVPRSLSPKNIPEGIDPFNELKERAGILEHYIESLEKSGVDNFLKKNAGSRIFIGHGRSPLWRELKDFLNDRLSLPWDEFNREAVAGFTTFERISEMLDSASFAFLVMTAEDQHDDSTTHARQNVVHEVGLFQGRLGPKKAIILLEEGCSEFSNVAGLSQIRFPKGHISAVFEEIRRVLEREGVIKT
jgi:hypothetical protein